MSRRVLYILGTSWCGSSLLNALLGTQPGVAALGEAAHLRRLDRTDAWCARCRCPVQQCRLADAVSPQRFYASLFQLHPQCSLIVDSSKNWPVILDGYRPERQFRYQAVLLSKSPHRFAHSLLTHQPGPSVADAFELWMRFHQRTLAHLALLAEPSYAAGDWAAGPAIAAADLRAVSYAALAAHPTGVVARICEFVGLRFERQRLSGWCRPPQHCVIGGNVAIYAQLTGNRRFFEPQSSYLGGKYAGRFGQIFLDNAWSARPAFIRQCLAEYERRRRELEPLLPAVGQPSWSRLVDELKNADLRRND